VTRPRHPADLPARAATDGAGSLALPITFASLLVAGAIVLGSLAGPQPRAAGRAPVEVHRLDDEAPARSAILPVFSPPPLIEALLEQPDLATAAARLLPDRLLPDIELNPVRLVKTIAVGRGDTLMKLLTAAGADSGDSHQAIAALKPLYDPRRLQLGQEITLTFERAGDEGYRLAALNLNDSVERSVEVVREDTGFSAQEIVREFDPGFARATGVIEDNLYNAALEAGLPSAILGEMIRLFSYDVDFQREVQPGDSFEVFFERFYDDAGKAVKEGRLLYASMALKGSDLRYFLYAPSDDGRPDYFNARGQSVRKALLRTPMDGARLTSGFGKRSHPVLGYTKMHKGVDFAAATGTPIQAAGDGLVETAGVNGGYGNYVRIRHSSGYSTAYAHMSRIAVRAGQRVRQGQVIGQVGSTGLSTGPHLHYEVLVNNSHINPLSVRLPTGRVLEGRELARFRQAREEIEGRVAATPARTWLAGE
jgi:murein DD-endopeptidase MepM/ murein hydrolase activator NlpD